jgi:hypothetical protein
MTREIRPPVSVLRISQSPLPNDRHSGMPIGHPYSDHADIMAETASISVGHIFEPISYRLGAACRTIENRRELFFNPAGMPLSLRVTYGPRRRFGPPRRLDGS